MKSIFIHTAESSLKSFSINFINFGPLWSATSLTSLCDNGTEEIPAARLVHNDIAKTSIPKLFATIHSGTVLIPKAPIPIFLPPLTSDGVS